MKTREGNEVYPASAPIRAAIRGNGKSLCASCVHVADVCHGIEKRISKSAIKQVYSCEGYEDIKTQPTGEL